MSFWIQYPNLAFNEADHRYTWNGRQVPSVTGIFDSIGFRSDDKKPFVPMGCPDFAKREHDAVFGKAFHKMANAIVSGKKLSVPDEMIPWRDKVQKFMDKRRIEPLFDTNANIVSEYPMYSVFYRFAGTPDFCGRDIESGHVVIIDWKSSAIYHKSYSWQTAGYSILLREVFGGKIFDKREKIVRITVLVSADKEEAEPIYRLHNPEDLIAFQSIYNTYKLAS